MPDIAPRAPRRRLKLVAETCLHTLVFPGTILLVLPWMILVWLPESGRFESGALPGWLLAALVLLGLAGGVKLSWDLIRQGDGTPNPLDPPRRLVVTSLYRHVRNPGYLAVFAILLSQALFFGSTNLLIYTLLAVGGFHAFVVRVEEPGLRARFGAEYETFCAAVPGWIPRLRPWDPPEH